MRSLHGLQQLSTGGVDPEFIDLPALDRDDGPWRGQAVWD
jgi:hypothetical protein